MLVDGEAPINWKSSKSSSSPVFFRGALQWLLLSPTPPFCFRGYGLDEGLDVIAEGLGTLKNMASDMNEELDRQVPLMDEIDTKVDKATSDLKNTSVRLKHTATQLRSSRNFCIDILLLCIILGIAAYLYNVLKK